MHSYFTAYIHIVPFTVFFSSSAPESPDWLTDEAADVLTDRMLSVFWCRSGRALLLRGGGAPSGAWTAAHQQRAGGIRAHAERPAGAAAGAARGAGARAGHSAPHGRAA